MRWPWVSQSTYNRHTQVLIDAQASLIQQNEWMNDAYEALLDKYHALKVQGATVPEAPRNAKPVDPVSAAITQAAGHDPKLRALMAREAMRMRAAQFPDHEIVEAIQNGVTSMEGLPA